MLEYEKGDLSLWSGRVDSEIDYDSFRWHQIIKLIDLQEDFEIASSDLSFILIGYQIDEGIKINKGRVGASKGPNRVRSILSNRPCSFSQEVRIYDGGNVNFVDTVKNAQLKLASLVTKCLQKGYFPIVIGGGHDVAYGTMTGTINYLEQYGEDLASINFDAHFDMRSAKESTSGTMFNQIYYDLLERNKRFHHLTVGIQKSSNTTSLFKFTKQINSPYILARDFNYEHKYEIMKKIFQFMANEKNLYLTVCTDVFASPYAPGVSSPNPLGIMPDLFLDVLKDLLSSKKVRAFDIAEVAPDLDVSDATATLASLIVYTIVNHLANDKED